MNIKGYTPHIFTNLDINLPNSFYKKDASVESSSLYKDYNLYQDFENNFNKSGVSKDRLPFFAKLAKMESGFNHTIQNSAGYPAGGYFQFMDGTYTDKNGKTRSWSNIRDIAKVSVDEFINNPVLQIQSANKLADQFLSSFNEEDKRLARKKGYTDSALVAGAGLAGAGGVKKFLRGDGNPADTHGTNVAKRMDEFNGYFKDGGILKYVTGGGFEKYLENNRKHINNIYSSFSLFPAGDIGYKDLLSTYRRNSPGQLFSSHKDDKTAFSEKHFDNVRKYLSKKVSPSKLTNDVLYDIFLDFDKYNIKNLDYDRRGALVVQVKQNSDKPYGNDLTTQEVYHALEGLYGLNTNK